MMSNAIESEIYMPDNAVMYFHSRAREFRKFAKRTRVQASNAHLAGELSKDGVTKAEHRALDFEARAKYWETKAEEYKQRF